MTPGDSPASSDMPMIAWRRFPAFQIAEIPLSFRCSPRQLAASDAMMSAEVLSIRRRTLRASGGA